MFLFSSEFFHIFVPMSLTLQTLASRLDRTGPTRSAETPHYHTCPAGGAAPDVLPNVAVCLCENLKLTMKETPHWAAMRNTVFWFFL